MNYINFERKYVSNSIAGSIDTICLWKHQNGSVCEIEQYMTPNYVYMRFENGITVSITMEGSNFKIALDDDFRQRDLGTLFWLGVPFSRYSPAWKELYTNAYFEAAIQNKGFRDALLASKGKVLKHSMASGLTKDDTILTEAEFIDVLNLLRDSL